MRTPLRGHWEQWVISQLSQNWPAFHGSKLLYLFQIKDNADRFMLEACWRRERWDEDCWEIHLVRQARKDSQQQNQRYKLPTMVAWTPFRFERACDVCRQIDHDGDQKLNYQESETQKMILHAAFGGLRAGTLGWRAVRPSGNHILILPLWAIGWPFCRSCNVSTTLS